MSSNIVRGIVDHLVSGIILAVLFLLSWEATIEKYGSVVATSAPTTLFGFGWHVVVSIVFAFFMLATVILGICVIRAFFGFLNFGFIARKYKEGDVYLSGDKEVKIFHFDQWLWRNETKGWRKYIIYPTSIYGMKVTPITSNPKVRSLSYDLTVVPILTPAGIKNHQTLFFYGKTKERNQNNFVTSLLYDFNEEQSKELAKFFNPLKKEQQDGFKNLLEESMGEKLELVGLKIGSAKFRLN
jgi:hypothetical protein